MTLRLTPMTFRLTPMTLQLKGDLDILKMYFQTENEVHTSSPCKGISWSEKQWKQFSRSKLKVKCCQTSNTSSARREIYSYQLTSISHRIISETLDTVWTEWVTDRDTHMHTYWPKTKPASSIAGMQLTNSDCNKVTSPSSVLTYQR